MSVRASSSSVGVRAWLASVSGAGAAVIETGEWASGSAKCMARCWDQCIGSDMGVHHQFRMQFGGQTNRQRGENRRISTMWIQSLKEWRGNCMRNWGGRVVLTEASGRHQSSRPHVWPQLGQTLMKGGCDQQFRVLELCAAGIAGIE